MLQCNDILFLDVEGTLIESMDSPVFLNNTLDNMWFKDLVSNATEVHCFSWALCNQREVDSSEWLIQAIEDRIGVKFKRVVFRDEMFSAFRKRFGNFDFIEFEEMCRSLGKEFVFQFFIRNIFNRRDFPQFTLVDDMVENTVLAGGFGTIRTINVKGF